MTVDALARGCDQPATDLGVEISGAGGEAEEGQVDRLPDSIAGGVHEKAIARVYFCAENGPADLTLGRIARRNRRGAGSLSRQR